MTTTTNLGIPLIDPSQSQKEVTINQAFTCFDAMIGSSVADKDLSTPPGSPSVGVVYIVAASPTGAWSGKATYLTYFDQVWRFIAPVTGMRVFVRDEAQYYQFSGMVWNAVSGSGGDMLKATYDPANIAQQILGTTAAQTLTNKIIHGANNTLTVRLNSDVSNTLPVANGGTGQTSYTDGQILIGNSTGNTLAKSTLTAGSGISITNGAGSITITATGGGGSGDVVGPASATSTALARFSGTTGKLIQNSGVLVDASNNISGLGTVASGAQAITSSSASALAVGLNGATNPALLIDASTASSATGLQIKSAAVAGGVAVTAISSGTNENLTLNAKGTGTTGIGTVSTGTITVGNSSVGQLNLSSSNTNGVQVNIAGSLKHTLKGDQVILGPTTALSTASTVRFSVTSAADTALTASTEAPHTYFNLSGTRQHATGALSLQRDFRITGSTHSAVAASVFTNVAAFSVDGPVSAGTNATITNSHGFYLPSAALTGTVTNAYGISINAPTGASNNYAAQFNGAVGIGTATPNASALLDVASTTQAFLPPRMSTTQKNAISSPAAGAVVYDNTLAKLCIYNGSSWDTATSGTATSPLICDGRLTLTTATAVTTADVTAATTVYYTPYKGNRIALFDGTSTWTLLSFSEISLTVPATTNTMYDMFAYNNAGVVALEALAWTNDTTRATGLVFQDGVYVKSGATTRRYLGSFRTTATSGRTEDSKANRYVWNYYNRVRRLMQVVESTATWTYSTATFRQANASSSNQLNFILGVSEDAVTATVRAEAFNSTATMRYVFIAIGLDSTTTRSADCIQGGSTVTNSTYLAPIAVYEGLPAAGRHYLSWLEGGASADTQTWEGGSTYGGISGTILG